jgi:GT2 family glycosyltransferase
MSASTSPVLSIVVGIVSDTTEAVPRSDLLADCLEALAQQVDPPPYEIIVPHLEHVEGLEAVKARFPDVRFLPMPDVVARVGGREHHDVLRARGLAAGRGDLVGLLEDHARPDPRWAANVEAAHRQSHAAVGGAIENAVDRALNWAVYYCDFGRYQNPVPAGDAQSASDANVTYKRSELERVRSVWDRTFNEIVVNDALKSAGKTIVLDPEVIVYQNRRGLSLGAAVRERFSWGRSYAATRRAMLTAPQRLAYAALSPVLPAVLLMRMARTSWRRGSFATFGRALPLIGMLLVTWSAGEGVGYLLGVKTRSAMQPR